MVGREGRCLRRMAINGPTPLEGTCPPQDEKPDAARAQAARARPGPDGPDRPRAGLLRGVLRLRLLPRLGRGRGGRGDGRRDPRALRRRRLPRARGAARDRRGGDAAADAPRGPPVGTGCAVPDRRAHARPGRRLARARPRGHRPPRLLRRRVPAPPRRARGRVAPLGVEPPLLARRGAHPVRLPPPRRRAAPDRRVGGRRGERHPSGRGHHHPARARVEAGPGRGALRPHLGTLAPRPGRAARPARARGLRARGARHARGGAGTRRGRALSRTSTATTTTPRTRTWWRRRRRT